MHPARASKNEPTASASSWRPVAVIDVGSSAIRMEIAEIDRAGHVRSLEALQQPVNLGKDTFASGAIAPATIEECVTVLQGYRRALLDYGIQDDNDIRAVATSSVREASNRELFLNRIHIASHIHVEMLDEAEVNRLTYIAVRDSLEKLGETDQYDTLVVEVGGGSTELLLVQQGHVIQSRTYRLGSLRMRETLDTHRTPLKRMPTILSRHIQRTIDQIQRAIPPDPVQRMIALGGDVRFAVEELEPASTDQRLVPVPLTRFSKFARRVASQDSDELVRTHRLTFQEAETAGPALLAYARLGEAFQVERLLISNITLRDGLLLEMATQGAWTDHFKDQVIHSSRMLGHKYGYEETHALHVADLCGYFFSELQDEHELDERYELLLRVAALLHEIGLYVDNQSHHKHSLYLIQHSDLFGLSRKDRLLVALTARYHRRAMPKLSHPEYAGLPQADRLTVAKLAAILRVADALDQNHMQQLRRLSFKREARRLVVWVQNVEDLTLERLALQKKGEMFTAIYGMTVELRRDTKHEGTEHGP